MKAVIPVEVIEGKIFMIRGHKVMIDRDLAQLYGVETRVFNQAVKRNINRFPRTLCSGLRMKKPQRFQDHSL